MPSIEQVLAEGIEPFNVWYAAHPESASGCYYNDCPVYYYLRARTGGKELAVETAAVWDNENNRSIDLPQPFRDFIYQYDQAYLTRASKKEKEKNA